MPGRIAPDRPDRSGARVLPLSTWDQTLSLSDRCAERTLGRPAAGPEGSSGREKSPYVSPVPFHRRKRQSGGIPRPPSVPETSPLTAETPPRRRSPCHLYPPSWPPMFSFLRRTAAPPKTSPCPRRHPGPELSSLRACRVSGCRCAAVNRPTDRAVAATSDGARGTGNRPLSTRACRSRSPSSATSLGYAHFRSQSKSEQLRPYGCIPPSSAAPRRDSGAQSNSHRPRSAEITSRMCAGPVPGVVPHISPVFAST